MSSIRNTAAAAAASLACIAPAQASTFVYVANIESAEIAGYRVLSEDGALERVGRTAAGKVMPMAVSPDRRHLYAAVRAQPFEVQTYAIDKASGALQLLGSAALPESMAYLSLDQTGRTLLGASYGGHLISASRIEADGRVSAQAPQVIAVGRNAHAIRVDQSNRYAYVSSLGTDQIFQYHFDAATGQLSASTPAALQLKPVTGPRHLLTSHDNRFLFAVTEMRGTVITFGIDAKSGQLTELSTAFGLPPDTPLIPGQVRGSPGPDGQPRDNSRDIWASDMHLSPNGKFLFIAERTSSTLARFSVDQATGKLSYLGSTATETTPRAFAIDPKGRFLVVAGEKTESISVYPLDQNTGELKGARQYPGGKGASWVEIVCFD